jgi:ubiquinone/menaquinone biosynthesis C-methylase UbiE
VFGDFRFPVFGLTCREVLGRVLPQKGRSGIEVFCRVTKMDGEKMQKIYCSLKDAVIYSAYYLQNSFTDIIDWLLDKREEMTPPKRLAFSIGGNFKRAGEKFIQHFIELGGLKQSDRVLDVGCGVGRMAAPLAKYLNGQGSYEGFDIVAKSIDWCRENITRKYPNFHFQLADIYNKQYNPRGKHIPSQYKFPYDDKSFDFAFLTSVFTHMLPQDIDNYLSEISRVLKTDKKCLLTFFLVNEESSRAIEVGTSSMNFRFKSDGFRTISKATPEKAVAYDEELVRRLCEKHKLDIVEPIHYGVWCGRASFLSYQDIIIAQRSRVL